ncbi:MAG: response regulator [Planctomycetota bacterium]
MKLLLVDDDDTMRGRLARALSDRGLEVFVAAGVEQAVEVARREQPSIAVLDLKMPDGDGLDLLRRLRTLSPETRCIILTGYGSIANAVDAMQAGATGYVTKPADADQVLGAFRRALPTECRQSFDLATRHEISVPSLAEVEWNHIQQVLADCGGNVSQAAKVLNITRRVLQRKLRKLAPEPNQLPQDVDPAGNHEP